MFEDAATNDYQPEGNFEHFNFSVEKSSSQFFISVKDIIIEIYGINSKILTFFSVSTLSVNGKYIEDLAWMLMFY